MIDNNLYYNGVIQKGVKLLEFIKVVNPIWQAKCNNFEYIIERINGSYNVQCNGVNIWPFKIMTKHEAIQIANNDYSTKIV